MQIASIINASTHPDKNTITGVPTLGRPSSAMNRAAKNHRDLLLNLIKLNDRIALATVAARIAIDQLSQYRLNRDSGLIERLTSVLHAQSPSDGGVGSEPNFYHTGLSTETRDRFLCLALFSLLTILFLDCFISVVDMGSRPGIPLPYHHVCPHCRPGSSIYPLRLTSACH